MLRFLPAYLAALSATTVSAAILTCDVQGNYAQGTGGSLNSCCGKGFYGGDYAYKMEFLAKGAKYRTQMMAGRDKCYDYSKIYWKGPTKSYNDKGCLQSRCANHTESGEWPAEQSFNRNFYPYNRFYCDESIRPDGYCVFTINYLRQQDCHLDSWDPRCSWPSLLGAENETLAPFELRVKEGESSEFEERVNEMVDGTQSADTAAGPPIVMVDGKQVDASPPNDLTDANAMAKPEKALRGESRGA